MDTLIHSFRRLRSRKLWSENVAGGCYVIETTWGNGGWHVHLHIVCLCRYIPQHQLSRVWKTISGAKIVDIRRCKPGDLSGYVTHYLTKFDFPPEHRQEARDAMQGRRLWSPFGICHDVNLQYVRPPYRCPECQCCDWTCPDFIKGTLVNYSWAAG